MHWHITHLSKRILGKPDGIKPRVYFHLINLTFQHGENKDYFFHLIYFISALPRMDGLTPALHEIIILILLLLCAHKSSQTYVIKAAGLSAGFHGNRNAMFYPHCYAPLRTGLCYENAQGWGLPGTGQKLYLWWSKISLCVFKSRLENNN